MDIEKGGHDGIMRILSDGGDLVVWIIMPVYRHLVVALLLMIISEED